MLGLHIKILQINRTNVSGVLPYIMVVIGYITGFSMYLSSHFLSSTGFFPPEPSIGFLFHLKFLLAWNLRLTEINQIFCETAQVVVFPLLPKRTVRRPISLPGCPCPLKISMWNSANLSWCCGSNHTQTVPPLRKACTTVVHSKDCRLIVFFFF